MDRRGNVEWMMRLGGSRVRGHRELESPGKFGLKFVGHRRPSVNKTLPKLITSLAISSGIGIILIEVIF